MYSIFQGIFSFSVTEKNKPPKHASKGTVNGWEENINSFCNDLLQILLFNIKWYLAILSHRKNPGPVQIGMLDDASSAVYSISKVQVQITSTRDVVICHFWLRILIEKSLTQKLTINLKKEIVISLDICDVQWKLLYMYCHVVNS